MQTRPIIKCTGSSSGAGTAGADKVATAGETLTFEDTNTANTGLVYAWELVARPPGSAAALVHPHEATTTLVADVTGTYAVRARIESLRPVSDGDTALIHVSVPLANTGITIPDFTKPGWEDALTALMRALDASAPVIAHGIDVLVPGNAIAGNAFMLADLVGLLGPSDVVTIWLGYPHLNVDVLGAVFLQGFSGDSSGVYAFLDDAAGIPGLFAINLTGNDCHINWAVTKKTLPTP